VKKQIRLPLILAGLVGGAVLLASSGVYANGGAPEEFQHIPATYHEDGIDGVKPIARVGEYQQISGEDGAIEAKPVDDWLTGRSSTPGTSVGLGAAPLFDTYGVFRTSGSHKSTYVALGFIADELTMDEVGTSDSRDESGFSYGFGVNKSSSNFEYMMSVDQGNYDVSAIGMRFTSEF
jgi:hypothetical protein